MALPEDQRRTRAKCRTFAWLMGVVGPIVLVIVAFVISPQNQSGGEIQMMLYILLLLAVVQPFFYFLIERYQIARYRKEQPPGMNSAQLMLTLFTIRLAFVEGICIYGFIVYLLSSTMTYMIPFYIIATAWLFLHWPTEERFVRLLEKIDGP